jgi:hypothetical protein
VTIDAGKRGQCQVHVTGPVPEASPDLYFVVVNSTTFGVDGTPFTTELPDREFIRSTVEELAETFEDVSALAVTEGDQTGSERPSVGLGPHRQAALGTAGRLLPRLF